MQETDTTGTTGTITGKLDTEAFDDGEGVGVRRRSTGCMCCVCCRFGQTTAPLLARTLALNLFKSWLDEFELVLVLRRYYVGQQLHVPPCMHLWQWSLLKSQLQPHVPSPHRCTPRVLSTRPCALWHFVQQLLLDALSTYSCSLFS
jgi:hypothetical protein